MRRSLAAVAVLAAASLLVAGVAGGRKDARPAASVWVSPSGSDERSCRKRAEPCASLDRAYRAARPGEVVEIAAGRYGEQAILADPSKSGTKHVLVRPAKDARVTVEQLVLGSGDGGDGPRHLTIRGLRTAFAGRDRQRPVTVLPGTRDVDLVGLDAGNFTIWGAAGVRVLGGDWGPCAIGPDAPCGNVKIDAGPEGYPTEDVLVQGARIHDFRFGPECYGGGEDCHFECMYVNGSRNVTIRGSKFRDCALFDIFATVSGPDGARVGHEGLTIESNWFDTPWDESGPTTSARRRASAIALAWCDSSPRGYRRVSIRNNSFQSNTGVVVDESVPCSSFDVSIVGNLMAWDGCDARWRYAHNVYSSALRRGRCSRTDRSVGSTFPYRDGRSGKGFDFHLRDDWRPARGLVAEGCARRDVDGQKRPARRCDAGSDERR